MLISDADQNMYLLRFDPPGYPELTTGAAMVSNRIFYALGYHVPEAYLVYFNREQLAIMEGSEEVTSVGTTRQLLKEDIDSFLLNAARDPARGYRAMALRIPRSWLKILGPFQKE